jgi:hypothetical protein
MSNFTSAFNVWLCPAVITFMVNKTGGENAVLQVMGAHVVKEKGWSKDVARLCSVCIHLQS